MRSWDVLFKPDQHFRPNSDKTPERNRDAYLVRPGLFRTGKCRRREICDFRVRYQSIRAHTQGGGQKRFQDK